jgi:ribosomal protein S18 acetylase RimI-like enzyme
MSNNYSFREANIDDLPCLLNWTEDLMEHEALDPDIELPLADNISELLEEWLKNLLEDNNALLIIANDESDESVSAHGLIVGYLQLQPNNFTKFEMHGIIQMVWVNEEQRNKGLASQLVNQMEVTFKNLKIPYCDIQYSSSNKEAAAFWTKAGYQKISQSCRKVFNY